MFPEESRGHQEKLINLPFELSEKLLCNDEEQIEQFLNRLNTIYADNFMHKYSDFFPILMKIYEEDNAYNIDYLSKPPSGDGNHPADGLPTNMILVKSKKRNHLLL